MARTSAAVAVTSAPPRPGGTETRRALDSSALVKELEGVAAKLRDGSSTGKARLALLRRQAELGDLREALDLRARRGGPARPIRMDQG